MSISPKDNNNLVYKTREKDHYLFKFIFYVICWCAVIDTSIFCYFHFVRHQSALDGIKEIRAVIYENSKKYVTNQHPTSKEELKKITSQNQTKIKYKKILFFGAEQLYSYIINMNTREAFYGYNKFKSW